MKIVLLMWILTAPDSGRAVPRYVATTASEVVCLDIARKMNEGKDGSTGLLACHSEADAARAARECHPNGCAR